LSALSAQRHRCGNGCRCLDPAATTGIGRSSWPARALAGDPTFDKAFANGRNWATGDAVEHALTFDRKEVETA
jgi:hypothetical protein